MAPQQSQRQRDKEAAEEAAAQEKADQDGADTDPALASSEEVVSSEQVAVEETEFRPEDMARIDNFSPRPSPQEDVVYGECSSCRLRAPHQGPDKVRCPRCGLQPVVLAP